MCVCVSEWEEKKTSWITKTAQNVEIGMRILFKSFKMIAIGGYYYGCCCFLFLSVIAHIELPINFSFNNSVFFFVLFCSLDKHNDYGKNWRDVRNDRATERANTNCRFDDRRSAYCYCRRDDNVFCAFRFIISTCAICALCHLAVYNLVCLVLATDTVLKILYSVHIVC